MLNHLSHLFTNPSWQPRTHTCITTPHIHGNQSSISPPGNRSSARPTSSRPRFWYRGLAVAAVVFVVIANGERGVSIVLPVFVSNFLPPPRNFPIDNIFFTRYYCYIVVGRPSRNPEQQTPFVGYYYYFNSTLTAFPSPFGRRKNIPPQLFLWREISGVCVCVYVGRGEDNFSGTRVWRARPPAIYITTSCGAHDINYRQRRFRRRKKSTRLHTRAITTSLIKDNARLRRVSKENNALIIIKGDFFVYSPFLCGVAIHDPIRSFRIKRFRSNDRVRAVNAGELYSRYTVIRNVPSGRCNLFVNHVCPANVSVTACSSRPVKIDIFRNSDHRNVDTICSGFLCFFFLTSRVLTQVRTVFVRRTNTRVRTSLISLLRLTHFFSRLYWIPLIILKIVHVRKHAHILINYKRVNVTRNTSIFLLKQSKKIPIRWHPNTLIIVYNTSIVIFRQNKMYFFRTPCPFSVLCRHRFRNFFINIEFEFFENPWTQF